MKQRAVPIGKTVPIGDDRLTIDEAVALEEWLPTLAEILDEEECNHRQVDVARTALEKMRRYCARGRALQGQAPNARLSGVQEKILKHIKKQGGSARVARSKMRTVLALERLGLVTWKPLAPGILSVTLRGAQ